MAVMQCDICGSSLTMDVSGEFAICEFCGIKHPKQRLLNKISGGDVTANKTENKDAAQKSIEADAPVVSEIDGGADYLEEETSATEFDVKSDDEFGVSNAKFSDIGIDEFDETGEEDSSGIADSAVDNDFLDDEPVMPPPVIGSMDIGMDESMDESIDEPAVESGSGSVADLLNSLSVDAKEDSLSGYENDFTDDLSAKATEDFAGASKNDNGIGNVSASDGFDMEEAGGPVIVSSASDTLEEAKEERKQERIKELQAELAEFEEIFEANRNKFLGEGLRKKNYAEAKIKEIKERLVEFGVDMPEKDIAEKVVKEETSSDAEPDYTVKEEDVESMTQGEREEYEKKKKRVEELKAELQEFKEIYEANKGQFFGEGLKRKNYSETRIKEIREKLVELTS